MRIFHVLKEKIKCHKNPIAYWKAKGLTVGNRCEIYPSASFGSEPYLISLGNHVRVTAGVEFVTHDGGVWVLRDYLQLPNHEQIDLFGEIKVGNNVHIGINVTIMPNVTIGNNCIIGCGAVVTHDIPDNSIVVGVPAKVIKTIDDYAAQHMEEFIFTKHYNAEEKKQYLMMKYRR